MYLYILSYIIVSYILSKELFFFLVKIDNPEETTSMLLPSLVHKLVCSYKNYKFVEYTDDIFLWYLFIVSIGKGVLLLILQLSTILSVVIRLLVKFYTTNIKPFENLNLTGFWSNSLDIIMNELWLTCSE